MYEPSPSSRGKGGIWGRCLSNFVVPRTFFKTYIKTNIVPLKCIFPTNLKTWLPPWRERRSEERGAKPQTLHSDFSNFISRFHFRSQCELQVIDVQSTPSLVYMVISREQTHVCCRSAMIVFYGKKPLCVSFINVRTAVGSNISVFRITSKNICWCFLQHSVHSRRIYYQQPTELTSQFSDYFLPAIHFVSSAPIAILNAKGVRKGGGVKKTPWICYVTKTSLLMQRSFRTFFACLMST